MIRIRRLFWPTLFGVLGIAALVHGVDVLTGQEVTCGGQVMRSGDTCVTTTYERGRPSSTRTSDMDTQRVDNRIDGYLTAVGGPVVALLSGFVLYRRVRGERPPRQSRAVGRDCRAALAAIRGWRFVPHEPGLLRRWSKGPLSLWAFPDAYDVVSGLVDGVPFQVFDFRHRFLDHVSVRTAFVLALPCALADVDLSGGRRQASSGLRADSVAMSTGDVEFDQEYLVRAPSAAYAHALFTREVTEYVRRHEADDWYIRGDELIRVDRRIVGNSLENRLTDLAGLAILLTGQCPSLAR